MIGFYGAIFRSNGASLHYRQEISLYPFPGHIRSLCAVAAGNFVDLIQKNYPRLFDLFYRQLYDFVHIDQSLGFFLCQDLHGLRYFYFPPFGALGKYAAEHVFKINSHLLHTDIRENFNHRHAAVCNIQIDKPIVQFAPTKHIPELFTG